MLWLKVTCGHRSKAAEAERNRLFRTACAIMAGKKVVVVGHGPIGHSFIEKLAEREAGFDITVVCEEPRLAYNRVMLTQYFLDCDGDKHDQMKLSYWSEEDLKSKNVKLVYGRATSIDRDNKSVAYCKVSRGGSSVDEDADSLKYDILVLCTGSFCFVPPTPGFVLPEKKNPQWPDDPASRLEGAFVYRTTEDLEALIAAAKKSKRVTWASGLQRRCMISRWRAMSWRWPRTSCRRSSTRKLAECWRGR